MPDASQPTPAQRRAVRAGLLRKEWQEQRWRFFLATLVLSGLLAGLLRAQVIPAKESLILIYWPAGLLILLFLAMGPVASERANRTWEFLMAQPVSRGEVLRAKWLMGLLQLVGVMMIACFAGMVVTLLCRDWQAHPIELGRTFSLEAALRVGLFGVKATCALAFCYT